jgi:transcription antitermination factor NusG
MSLPQQDSVLTESTGPISGNERETDITHEERKWFALVVKPRHEKAADQILVNKGFETFLPLYRRHHRYGTRKREFEIPLFPGYLFCRFHPNVRLPVLSTPAVIQVAGAGRIPLPVDEAEVESLRIAAASPFAISPHPFLDIGRRVSITQGPLTGIEGIVVELKNSIQLIISITMLQRSVAVELDRAQVSIV